MNKNASSPVNQTEAGTHGFHSVDESQVNWLASVMIFFRFQGEGDTAFLMRPLDSPNDAENQEYEQLTDSDFQLVSLVKTGIYAGEIILRTIKFNQLLEKVCEQSLLPPDALQVMQITPETEREVIDYVWALSIAVYDAHHETDHTEKMKHRFSVSGKTLTPELHSFFKESGEQLHGLITDLQTGRGVSKNLARTNGLTK